MSNWIEDELKTINLGDKRLDVRAKTVLDNLIKSPGESIPRCFQSWGETLACYRLFNNDRVTPEKLISPHRTATIKRIQGEKTILCINDTSSIDFTGKDSIVGLGTLESDHTQGLFIHPTIAVTPERVCLGVIKSDIWARNNPVKHKSLKASERGNTPIEQKESYRWIKSYYAACDLAAESPNTQVISLADREGDIMELLLAAQERKRQGHSAADLIVRSNHNRRLLLQEDETSTTLRRALDQASSVGETEFMLQSREGKPKRIVKQAVKAITVTLKPKRIKGEIFEPVTINALMTEEINPPEDEEKISWIILTTLPIDSLENILKIVGYYICRWEIEIFFKVLKSGCEIEDRNLRNADRLENMIAMFMLVAWRVMYVMMIGRECPQMICTAIFEEGEWKAVFKICNKTLPLPDKPPLLGEFIKMIASLGGYLGRANDPPPGPKVMWKGMQRTFDFKLAWDAFTNT